MSRPAAPESRLSTLCPECGATDGHWKDCPRHSGKSESETPETDAALIPDEVTWMEGIVTADFARSLERRLFQEKKLSDAISRDCNATALERNELRTQLSLAQTEIKGHMRMVDELKQQLMEANWYWSLYFDECIEADVRLKDVQALLTEFEKDAVRYRYVREKPHMLLHLNNTEFDAAIDAAIDASLKDRA